MPTAVEFYLQIEGITGDFINADHKGAIQVMAFNFGVSQAEKTQTGGGGGGAGKATIGDLVVVKALDSRSPSLFLACAKGMHMHKGEFSIVPAVQDGVISRGPLATYKFTDVIIESVQQAGHEQAGGPTETVTIEFARLDTFTVGDGSV